MDFPAFPNPVFRVRGIKDDLSTAFILTSPFEEAARVKETLASGQYVDYGYSDMLYVWEAEAVEYEGQARERLGCRAKRRGGSGTLNRQPRCGSPRRKPSPRPSRGPTRFCLTCTGLRKEPRRTARSKGWLRPFCLCLWSPSKGAFPRRLADPSKSGLDAGPRGSDAHAQVSIRPERTPRRSSQRLSASRSRPPPQVPDRLERKMVEEIPDRVMASMPDLNEAPPPPVEVPTRPVRTPVEQTPSRILAHCQS